LVIKSRFVYKSNFRETFVFIAGKSDPARRYLGKSTTLDKLFSPAWLAYGHSFAAENEHDQAMAAYFKASQLMKG
jgi:anaphase-promoting complex subunit 6